MEPTKKGSIEWVLQKLKTQKKTRNNSTYKYENKVFKKVEIEQITNVLAVYQQFLASVNEGTLDKERNIDFRPAQLQSIRDFYDAHKNDVEKYWIDTHRINVQRTFWKKISAYIQQKLKKTSTIISEEPKEQKENSIGQIIDKLKTLRKTYQYRDQYFGSKQQLQQIGRVLDVYQQVLITINQGTHDMRKSFPHIPAELQSIRHFYYTHQKDVTEYWINAHIKNVPPNFWTKISTYIKQNISEKVDWVDRQNEDIHEFKKQLKGYLLRIKNGQAKDVQFEMIGKLRQQFRDVLSMIIEDYKLLDITKQQLKQLIFRDNDQQSVVEKISSIVKHIYNTIAYKKNSAAKSHHPRFYDFIEEKDQFQKKVGKLEEQVQKEKANNKILISKLNQQKTALEQNISHLEQQNTSLKQKNTQYHRELAAFRFQSLRFFLHSKVIDSAKQQVALIKCLQDHLKKPIFHLREVYKFDQNNSTVLKKYTTGVPNTITIIKFLNRPIKIAIFSSISHCEKYNTQDQKSVIINLLTNECFPLIQGKKPLKADPKKLIFGNEEISLDKDNKLLRIHESSSSFGIDWIKILGGNIKFESFEIYQILFNESDRLIHQLNYKAQEELKGTPKLNEIRMRSKKISDHEIEGEISGRQQINSISQQINTNQLKKFQNQKGCQFSVYQLENDVKVIQKERDNKIFELRSLKQKIVLANGQIQKLKEEKTKIQQVFEERKVQIQIELDSLSIKRKQKTCLQQKKNHAKVEQIQRRERQVQKKEKQVSLQKKQIEKGKRIIVESKSQKQKLQNIKKQITLCEKNKRELEYKITQLKMKSSKIQTQYLENYKKLKQIGDLEKKNSEVKNLDEELQKKLGQIENSEKILRKLQEESRLQEQRALEAKAKTLTHKKQFEKETKYMKEKEQMLQTEKNQYEREYKLKFEKLEKREIKLNQREEKMNLEINKRLESAFQGEIFYGSSKEKNFMIDSIEKKLNNREIRRTRLLYSFPKFKECKFHDLVDGRKDYVVIVELINNLKIAAYSKQPLQRGRQNRGPGFLSSLTNQKIFFLKKQTEKAKLTVYNDFFLKFGNSELLIKLCEPNNGPPKDQEKKVKSNFGQSNTNDFDSKQFREQEIIFGENKREAIMKNYEIFSVEFEDQ